MDNNNKAKVAEAILNIISLIPSTNKKQTDNPEKMAEKLIFTASIKSAGVSAALAIPPGPIGFLTVLPDLILIWEIQAQLVSDIAGLYGRQHELTQEKMIYCLFRHTAAHALSRMFIETSSRILVRRASLKVLQNIANRIGVRISQKVIGGGVARFIPFAGPIGIGFYAYYDTANVGNNTIDFFKHEIIIEEAGESD